MNPQASEWKPSVSAQAWTPGGGSVGGTSSSTPPPPAPAPTPALPVPEPTTTIPIQPPPPPLPEMQQSNGTTDENDPLWQFVYRLGGGNRDQAERMLLDPDALVAQYPQVEMLIAGTRTVDQVLAELSLLDNDDIIIDANAGAMIDTSVPQSTLSADGTATSDGIDDFVSNENQYDDNAVNAEDGGDDVDDDDAGPTAGMTTIATATMDEGGDSGGTGSATATGTTGVSPRDGDPREHLNLVFIGHVDAGKSTLSGNILYLTDNVDKRTIERYEKEAKERNRDSWFLAFVMDTNEEERAKGKTVEVGKAFFDTEVKRYTILDAPGHKNYVPNMIQGASQADVGILVISARKGEFETGFDRGGQTREHAMLAKTLGVSYLVVVVNKMDEPTVQWKKERFDECVTKIRPYLKQCGFTIKREVKFIPLSAFTGANVKDEVDPKLCPWWKKSYTSGENNTSSPTLLSLLDSLEISTRDSNAPLRIPILDRYVDRGTVCMGKVESGIIRPGMKVIVMPTRNKFKVDEVWVNEDIVNQARPGENVLIKLANSRPEDLRKGFVICGEPPCRAVDKIICQIAILDLPDTTKIMTAGFQCMFHAHTCEEECTISKIFETTNPRGLVVKGARFAGVNMRAIVMIELSQTAPLETFDHMTFLGRFTLRTEGKTVAIGKITKLPPKKE